METETNKFLVPVAIVVAGALVAGAIYFGGSSNSPQAGGNQRPAPQDIEVEAVASTDHILGNRSAQLLVVEYSDTECPFCKVFHNTMKEVLNTYGDQVAWVYRHFPIEQLHQLAFKEAEATECAADLGGNVGFWNYIDKVFEKTNSNDSLDPAELPRIAGEIGLDVPSFTSCLESGKYKDKITESVQNAYDAGARGTPYSVIVDQDGEVLGTINGAEPIASVKAKLDALLK